MWLQIEVRIGICGTWLLYKVDGHERVFSEPSFNNTNLFECYIQMSD